MGCHDQHSNYNALILNEEKGTWGAGWSPGVRSIEALDRERVLEKISTSWPSTSAEDWDISQLESGRWQARCKVLVP